ncbi:MAG: hypothetical protein ACIRZM_07870 [Ligilactobacillus ruminis]
MMKVCSKKMRVLFGLDGIHEANGGKDFLRLITLNIFEIGWIIDMVKTATDSYADFAGLPVVK